jgi:hypothetical protein
MRIPEMACHLEHATVREIYGDDSVPACGKKIDQRAANPACSTRDHDDAS